MPYERERLPETPSQAPGPIAWENPERVLFGRLLGTLASTFLPLTTIRAVSAGTVGPALRFALLSALPWMALWGIMPFTHTLEFKFNFAVDVIHKPGMLSIPWDVARAAGIGLVLGCIALLSWALPFVSLLRAYGSPPEAGVSAVSAAWRMALYRAWVIPCGLSLLALFAWSMPPEANPWLIEVSLLLLHLLPRILILMHCFAMARYFGVEGMASMVVSMVPLAVEIALGLLVDRGVRLYLLPQIAGQVAGAAG